MKGSIKIPVIDLNLRQIKIKIVAYYTGESEMIGKLSFVDQIREKHFRFGNITDYLSFINSFDQDHESEESICNGYLHKLKTRDIIMAN